VQTIGVDNGGNLATASPAGVDVAVFLLMAKVMRIGEVTSVLALVTDRLRR